MSLAAAKDWSRAGSSLSLPLESSAHKSRSSSKRPRFPTEDEHTGLEDTGAEGSDALRRRVKKAKGPAR